MDDRDIDTELLVIGGGPGGYTAAIRGANLGLETTLVERDAYGGTCLNHGCIPSKALISAADTAHSARSAEDMGVFADPAVDMAGVADWKDGIVTRLGRGVESLCDSAGVRLVDGTAAFVDSGTVRVSGSDDAPEAIGFENAVIATGSRPVEIQGFEFDADPILSSRDAVALETVPDDLLVVGAGYIGMELSTVFAKLGASVTVVEMRDSVLPTYEPDVSKIVRRRAESLGIEFSFGEVARDWDTVDDGIRVHTTDSDDEVSAYDADRCLVAVGREPVTDTLGLDSVPIEPDDNSVLTTDDRARTSLDGVFAVGDVTGDPMLAHGAMAEGKVAAGVAAGEPATLDHHAIPAAVFTDPEVGTVGMTEAEARDDGFDPVVSKVSLRANGRALTVNDRDGFVRLVADAETEFLLGAQIVCPEASELLGELSLAIEMGARLEDIASTVHTHPTLSEAIAEAATAARADLRQP
jgi:dihydrolipoamide dehydrogenase